MTFSGAANALSAAKNVVSEDAIQSVQDGILESLHALEAPKKPPQSTQLLDPQDQASRIARADLEHRQLQVLYHHDAEVQQREHKERIRLMLIGLGAFAVGFFMEMEAKKSESRHRSTYPFPSGSRPERSLGKHKTSSRRQPITVRIE